MAGSITGRVVDIRGNQPLANAELQLSPSGGSQTAGDGGEFSFADLPAGADYELTVSADGYDEAMYGPLVVVDGNASTFNLALSPSDY